MTAEQIFQEIITHAVKGLMVHEQLANYYDFLGLSGYKKCHEYHYYKESKEYRELYHFYISTYNKLLPDMKFDNPNVIPSGWIGYTRQMVDTKTKRNAVQDGLTQWVNWETETKSMLERMYKELIDIGEVYAASKISEMICDVAKELKTAEKYQLNKIANGYDIISIIDEQKRLHEKYKCLIKED